MKIMITGAEGMVGSRLSKYLTRKGHDVVEFQGDVTQWEDWWKYTDAVDGYDFLVHLAALAGVRPSFDNPDLYYNNNVEGTRNAIDFAEILCGGMLYASSSNAYEWWGNPYAATKKMNEVQAVDKNAIGMRFHTVWPGRDDMLFQKFARNDVTYVNRNHYRDFIHVEDLLDGIYTLMENFDHLIEVDHTVCDIGTGHATPVEEVAKIFNFDGEWRDENPTGERTHTKADVEYLLQLGWTPKYNILNKEHHKDYE